jgi:hypothetical protein
MMYQSKPAMSRNGLSFTVEERNAAMDSFRAMGPSEGSEIRRKVAAADYRLTPRAEQRAPWRVPSEPTHDRQISMKPDTLNPTDASVLLGISRC